MTPADARIIDTLVDIARTSSQPLSVDHVEAWLEGRRRDDLEAWRERFSSRDALALGLLGAARRRAAILQLASPRPTASTQGFFPVEGEFTGRVRHGVKSPVLGMVGTTHPEPCPSQPIATPSAAPPQSRAPWFEADNRAASRLVGRDATSKDSPPGSTSIGPRASPGDARPVLTDSNLPASVETSPGDVHDSKSMGPRHALTAAERQRNYRQRLRMRSLDVSGETFDMLAELCRRENSKIDDALRHLLAAALAKR